MGQEFQRKDFNQKLLEIRNLLDVAERVIQSANNRFKDVEHHQNIQI